jgi:hypothetical protein
MADQSKIEKSGKRRGIVRSGLRVSWLRIGRCCGGRSALGEFGAHLVQAQTVERLRHGGEGIGTFATDQDFQDETPALYDLGPLVHCYCATF